MKEIKVTVISSSELELQEPAEKGDRINLATLNKIDSTFISNLIEKQKNDEMNKRVHEARLNWEKEYGAKENELKAKFEKNLSEKTLELKDEHQKKIDDLNDKISKLMSQIEADEAKKKTEKDLLIAETEKKYSTRIQELEDKLNQANADYSHEIENIKSHNALDIKELESKLEIEKAAQEKIKTDVENQYQKQISELQNQLSLVEKQNEFDKQTAEKEIEQKFKNQISDLEKEKELLKSTKEIEVLKAQKEREDEIAKYKNEAEEFKSRYSELLRTKSSLNVKMIGENLESWCNNSYETARTYGAFKNCTWKKDNTLVKNEGENGSGTKADYIFKAYANEQHDFVITSACLDMKSENPDSTTKKKNADHYKKLDSDRTKKGCEYAILVSELEMKSDNDIPVMKVHEYPNMYVVRPSYFLTFLGILMNLGQKYADIVNAKVREDEKFKTGEDIKKEFEQLKDTYLNKPLNTLTSKVESIRKDANTIIEKGTAISKLADEIITSSLESMKKKIEKLSIELPKIENKVDALKN